MQKKPDNNLNQVSVLFVADHLEDAKAREVEIEVAGLWFLFSNACN